MPNQNLGMFLMPSNCSGMFWRNCFGIFFISKKNVKIDDSWMVSVTEKKNVVVGLEKIFLFPHFLLNFFCLLLLSICLFDKMFLLKVSQLDTYSENSFVKLFSLDIIRNVYEFFYLRLPSTKKWNLSEFHQVHISEFLFNI
jgi:hypothetical protein